MHTPFNGDHFIGIEIRKLVERFKIATIIETGMWSAHSTREFATMVPHVITMDSTPDHLFDEFGLDAVKELPENVSFVQGDSSRILNSVIPTSETNHPVLFYLDAHGGGNNGSNVNPVLEELDTIGATTACRDRCVVCVHDVQVPGKPWGYNGGDWGRGFEPLSHWLFESRLKLIYPGGYGHHHNEEAAGCQRGILYVYPKEK